MEHVAHLQRMANESWIGSPERAALDAAIAVLSAPQPLAEAQADEVVCLECGQPTMHMGQVCYACSHPAAKPAEAQGGGEAELRHTVAKLAAHVRPTCSDLWAEAERILNSTAPPSAPVGVEEPLFLLRAGHWREVYVGHRCMRLEVTYEHAAWERLMEQVEAALAQQPAAVDGESVTIDGRRYDLDTVRTALLGLAADVARGAAQPGGSDNDR